MALYKCCIIIIIIAPSPCGICTQFNTWFLWITQVYPPIGISVGFAVFARLANVTNRKTHRHTDRPRFSVCSNRPYLAIAAMRLKITILGPLEIHVFQIKTSVVHSSSYPPGSHGIRRIIWRRIENIAVSRNKAHMYNVIDAY